MAAATFLTNASEGKNSPTSLLDDLGDFTPGGTNVGIVVDVAYSDPSVSGVTGVDWAGEAFTFLAFKMGTNCGVEVWYKQAPTTTTGTVTVNITGSPTYGVANITWFTNCNQTGFIGSSILRNAGTSPTDTTLTGTSTNNLIFHACSVNDGTSGTTLTVSAGSSEIHNTIQGSAASSKRTIGASCYIASLVGSISAGFSESINRNFAAIGVELLAVGATLPPKLLAILGVG